MSTTEAAAHAREIAGRWFDAGNAASEAVFHFGKVTSVAAADVERV